MPTPLQATNRSNSVSRLPSNEQRVRFEDNRYKSGRFSQPKMPSLYEPLHHGARVKKVRETIDLLQNELTQMAGSCVSLEKERRAFAAELEHLERRIEVITHTDRANFSPAERLDRLETQQRERAIEMSGMCDTLESLGIEAPADATLSERAQLLGRACTDKSSCVAELVQQNARLTRDNEELRALDEGFRRLVDADNKRRSFRLAVPEIESDRSSVASPEETPLFTLAPPVQLTTRRAAERRSRRELGPEGS